MIRSARYQIGIAPEVLDHLGMIERKHHRIIQRAINQQLSFAPEERTRNRKPIEQPGPFSATWELRLGPDNRFRVFYEVDRVERVVWIVAIGVKERDRLFVGGEEIEL